MSCKTCKNRAKQVPEKPVKRESTNMFSKWATYFCPVCGEEVKENVNYCSTCGQKMDWSEK